MRKVRKANLGATMAPTIARRRSRARVCPAGCCPSSTFSGDAARMSRGWPPRDKGLHLPADPPAVEEVVAVMRCAGDGSDGIRMSGLIVVRLRISEALALDESDLGHVRGAILVRSSKSIKRLIPRSADGSRRFAVLPPPARNHKDGRHRRTSTTTAIQTRTSVFDLKRSDGASGHARLARGGRVGPLLGQIAR